jgi:hypothetical protein
MGTPPPDNTDLLDEFDESERGECSSCGQRACVSLPETPACFCFACGAVSVGGMRLDVAREIPTEI